MTYPPTEVALKLKPVAGNIGAEVEGIDLGAEFDAETIAAIRSALLQHKVLFFRDQNITHEQQLAFASCFGEVTPTTTSIHKQLELPNGIGEIVTTRMQELFGGKRVYPDAWHADITAAIRPPAFGLLRGKEVPPYGGDTQWSNVVAAYENLPVELQELADKLRAVHSYDQRRWEYDSDLAKMQRSNSNPPIAIHPVVRVHPETDEKALYVNQGFTSGFRLIEGWLLRESQWLLELFWEAMTRPEYTVRFRWEPGSVAFWDERSTVHLAPADNVTLEHPRVMYRCTIQGDIPVGPDGRQSELVSGPEIVGY